MIGIIFALSIELGIGALAAVAPIWPYSQHWTVGPMLALFLVQLTATGCVIGNVSEFKRLGQLESDGETEHTANPSFQIRKKLLNRALHHARVSTQA